MFVCILFGYSLPDSPLTTLLNSLIRFILQQRGLRRVILGSTAVRVSLSVRSRCGLQPDPEGFRFCLTAAAASFSSCLNGLLA